MSGGQATVADLRSERNHKKRCMGSFWALCCVGQLQALSCALGETISQVDVGQDLAGSINDSFAASGLILAFWHPDGVLLLICCLSWLCPSPCSSCFFFIILSHEPGEKPCHCTSPVGQLIPVTARKGVWVSAGHCTHERGCSEF